MAIADRRTVLVVDDEPTITEVVARYLQRAGYRTAIAADGVQALVAAGEQSPDLVVLDLMLPKLGGLEVMRRLREHDHAGVPIILRPPRERNLTESRACGSELMTTSSNRSHPRSSWRASTRFYAGSMCRPASSRRSRLES